MISMYRTLTFISILVLASAAPAEPATAPDCAPAVDPMRNDETAASKAVSAKLDEIVTEISAENQGFSRVIDFMGEKMKVNFDVNWRALEAAAVDRNTQVTINVKQVPCRKALTMLLSQVGGGATPLTFYIDNGLVGITTLDDCNARLQIIRTYDCGDLFPPAPPVEVSDENGARIAFYEKAVKDVIDTIANTVDPTSWKTIGDMPGTGTIGTIREVKGQLVVNQTPRNHAEIARLVAALREPFMLQVQMDTYVLSLASPLPAFIAKNAPGLALQKAGEQAFLGDAEVATLLEAIGKVPTASVVAAPRTLALNGQSAAARTLKHTPYTVIVNGGAYSEPTPVNLAVDGGLDMTVTAQVNAQTRQVAATIKATYVLFEGFVTAPAPAGKPAATRPVQEPIMSSFSQDARVIIPEGQTLVLGGNALPEADAHNNKFIYMLIRPTIVARKVDATTTKPAVK